MLQQTQVATVLPYYERWMRRLPALTDLAAAPPGLLLRLWAGLGYYRRVRNAHAAARFVCARYDGRFPCRYQDVLELPGIGPYSAGAICSIAFNQPTPVLDGNVLRLLTRLFALPGDPRAGPLNAWLWQCSESLVKAAAKIRPARFRPCATLNQALMELGALICTPKQPRCPECPLNSHCLAAQSGKPMAFPQPRKRPVRIDRHFLVLLLRHDSRILIRRQPETGWNVGLWEFPSFEARMGRSHWVTLLPRRLKVRADQLRPLGQVQHSITRYRLLLDVYSAEMAHSLPVNGRAERWCRSADLQKVALSGAHRKILSLAGLFPSSG